jgi:hypothetical protein
MIVIAPLCLNLTFHSFIVMKLFTTAGVVVAYEGFELTIAAGTTDGEIALALLGDLFIPLEDDCEPLLFLVKYAF